MILEDLIYSNIILSEVLAEPSVSYTHGNIYAAHLNSYLTTSNCNITEDTLV